METRPNERDMVLPPNTYCHILDETKGQVTNYVGPNKTSLSANDKPVEFNGSTKQFATVQLQKAIKNFKTAPEGWYAILKNPTNDQLTGKMDIDYKSDKHDLQVGRKINVPGPVNFPLMPGQMAKVVKGHHLKSNQYLVVRVYDEEAAKKDNGIVTPNSDGEDKVDKLNPAMGKLGIIRGTSASFYIPPTGVEVVNMESTYVQEAVSLERLEYCILRGENGEKRYVKGPDVVFPEPTESFVVEKGKNKETGESIDIRKYRAKELSEISGLYIKVTTDYEEGDRKYTAGEELFITGKDQPLYYPREEHGVIKYDKNSIHFATAIPAGEARYLMNRLDGKIETVKGPSVLLPDPRTHVLVRRVLDLKQVGLWFPGNQKALDYNQNLLNLLDGDDGSDVLTNQTYVSSRAKSGGAMMDSMALSANLTSFRSSPTSKAIAGEKFDRKTGHTQPRTVTLNTKFEGAVNVDIWTGYAVNIVKKAGSRRTVVGPTSVILDYDEYLETTQLSKGMPKLDHNTIKTAYLRVLNNRVSDVVEAESKDLCEVKISLAYKVNFEGDAKKWFDVENYVSYLCGHMRSMIKNCVKSHKIEDFYGDSISIIRDLILSKAKEEGGRVGYTFVENGMRVCDLEVSNVKIQDKTIENMLVTNQNETVGQILSLQKEERRLEVIMKQHEIKRKISEVTEATDLLNHTNQVAGLARISEIDNKRQQQTIEMSRQQLLEEHKDQEVLNKIQEEKLSRKQKESETSLTCTEHANKLEITRQEAQVKAFVDRFKAIEPKFIEALQANGNKALITELSKNLSPMALLGGESVVDVAKKLLSGTILEKSLDALTGANK